MYVPLHVTPPCPLVLFDRPFSDVISPAEDPRLKSIIAVDPRIAIAAVSYLTSCWSSRDRVHPDNSVSRCWSHRLNEIDSLRPSLIIAVGENVFRKLVEVDYYQSNLISVTPEGIRVLSLPDDPELVDAAVMHEAINSVGVYYDLS